jgi:hypothetical protein
MNSFRVIFRVIFIVIISFILSLILTSQLSAKEEVPEVEQVAYRDRFASFSILPGLDTNPGTDPPVKNNLALNLFAGYGGALSGFELSGIGAIRSGPVKGFQLAGIFNLAETFYGLEVGGITNIYHGGPSRGATISGIVDISAGEITGLQLAGNVAIARAINGLQVSVVSISWGAVYGSQVGVVSYAGDLVGFQLGVSNITVGNMDGFQLGVTNVTAGQVSSGQLGVVNWATKTDGFMLGVVNLAAEGGDSIPIGLVNLIGEGMFTPTLWTSDTSLTNVAIKMGSRRIYSILGGGFNPEDAQFNTSVLVGIGGHLDLGDPWWLEIDLVTHSLSEDYDFEDTGLALLNKLRATFGWQLGKRLAVYGGLSLNVFVAEEFEHAGPAWLRLWADQGNDANVDIGLGLLLGVQM